MTKEKKHNFIERTIIIISLDILWRYYHRCDSEIITYPHVPAMTGWVSNIVWT